MILGLAMLALGATLALAAYLGRKLQTARLELEALDAALAQLREPLPPSERVDRRRAAR